MKIRIVKEGLFGNPELKVGMTFTLNGHPPAAWAGFYEVISNDDVEGKAAITNPKRDPLDHDGDGVRGGSLKGKKSTRSIGSAKDADTKEGEGE